MAKFNEYPAKTIPEDGDSLMVYDAAAKANKLSPFSGIWNWMVGKLTNAVIANLQTNNKTVLGAINELNSNSLKLDYIECDINTVANEVIRITPESITKGEAPKDDHYIPIIHAQDRTNAYEASIRYDHPSWIVYSNVSQSLGIRFYKCTK